MTEHVIKLPDVGEGIAEAELVEWLVKVGDIVREDTPLGAVMTDKATVEIPSPVEGEVVWLAGEVGDVLAIGSDFVRLNVNGTAKPSTEAKPPAAQPASAPAKAVDSAVGATPRAELAPRRQNESTAQGNEKEKPIAAPAVRLRARE
ncbi:MAG: 2-oxo acid dehydrogenase subunit E2, partial [Bradyrhizobium sp.]|nr:2-oxo acid dehydrogenase subunit E2 [Bradyrhizobium sp.]